MGEEREFLTPLFIFPDEIIHIEEVDDSIEKDEILKNINKALKKKGMKPIKVIGGPRKLKTMGDAWFKKNFPDTMVTKVQKVVTCKNLLKN